MPDTEPLTAPAPPADEPKFVQGLGLLDSTMIVAGSMIGSGIFIVSADIARHVGSGGWLHIYLREAYSPLWGFLYGWTLFLVIQTGTIAAVAVAFARYLGVLVPKISPTSWIIAPINISSKYAISLSTQQLVGILLIVLLTIINTRGLKLGKIIQNIFTSAKTLSLIALIFIGLVVGRNADAVKMNFSDFWTPRGVEEIKPDLGSVSGVVASAGAFGLFIAFCVAQVGSLFSADAWNNITFTAGEVKNPRRNIPLSLAAGTGLVITLSLLANVAYLCMLPLDNIQHAPDDRVATAAMETVFTGAGPVIMAVAIMISAFGCNNGLILAGARVYYAMARDSLFFKSTGKLNRHSVPAFGLVLQCVWACLLVLPRTRLRDPVTGAESYGNLYGSLLDYVVFAVLIFYVLTIIGLFILRRKRPEAERPYRAFGYPIIPALYIIAASTISIVLLLYKTKTSLPGLFIVLTGIPAYFLWNLRRKTRLPD